MAPTLLEGDRFYVDKRLDRANPGLRRGDLVLYISPQDQKTIYVKRVIGLPGDRLDIFRDVVSVNGEKVPHTYDGLSGVPQAAIPENSDIYAEHLPEGSTYFVAYPKQRSEAEPDAIFETHFEANVSKGTFYVMGDNRGGSYDSRAYGAIPSENLLGKPLFIWYSAPSNVISIRWNRIGKAIRQ